MKEIKQTLASQLKQIMEDLQKGTKENGKTIFDTQGLENLVQNIDPFVIQASVEEILKTSLKQSDLDLIILTNASQLPESVVYEASYAWVLSPRCSVDVKRLTLFDKFVSEYDDSAKRQAILREAKNLSAPFLYFVPSEIGKNPELANLQTIAEVTTIPDGIGRITPQGQPAQQIIQQDLESVGIPRNKIKIADDQERIIFLQEKQAFPLRFIDSLLKLKAEYETFPDKSVLHIDRQLEGQLYDLYLLSPQEQQERLDTEQTFIIARVYGWLKQTTNQSTRQSEIRYEFEESGKIGTKKLVLGTGIDWEAARNILVDDVTTINPKNAQVREVRQRLTQKAKILRQQLPTSPDSFEEMQTLFQKYLAPDDLLKYPAGIDDPRYERDQNIINSILDSIN
ncbi:MAG: hypothetical protein ACKO2V_00585 [Snowella sp.]